MGIFCPYRKEVLCQYDLSGGRVPCGKDDHTQEPEMVQKKLEKLRKHIPLENGIASRY